ncbi:hypothetical protein HAALTHF_46330n [Vreelandella aquamarina]|nr:hypothetical protein HAALTHF_46330n [Halomonas axialensis]
MKETLRQRLDSFSDRFEELAMLLSDPEVINNQQRFRDYSREYSELEELVAAWKRYLEVENSIAEAEQLSRDSDPEMRELAEMEILDGREQLETLDVELKRLLIPKDPDDGRGVFLEVRAGTGGDEAAIFAGDLFRMYSRYAEKRGWRVEIVSASHGEQGGYKEVISRVKGDGVYARLKFESGAHRVQRVPATESQGRIHTSACTVAVMPEVDEVGILILTLRICGLIPTVQAVPVVSTLTPQIPRSVLPTCLPAWWWSVRKSVASIRTAPKRCRCLPPSSSVTRWIPSARSRPMPAARW